MYYRKFSPSVHLLPFVECYFALGKQGTNEVYESPPTGFASMVFNYGDAYYVDNYKHNSLLAPSAFLYKDKLADPPTFT